MIIFFSFSIFTKPTMHYSPKNKKRDNNRRLRQKSKNGVSPQMKRHLKRMSNRITRRNIRKETKGHLKSAPSISPSPSTSLSISPSLSISTSPSISPSTPTSPPPPTSKVFDTDLMTFVGLIQCTCCDRHQHDRPTTMEGFVEYPFHKNKDSQEPLPGECLCQCRHNARALARYWRTSPLRQNAVCYDDNSLVTWARNLPFQSVFKHNLATDIQMAWRKRMLSKRIKTRATGKLLRMDINSVLQTICELREFTNSSYVHLLDCSPLTATLEFMYDRLYEISKLHYADMPAPSQRLFQYNEWYHLNGTIDRAHLLLEKATDRITSVINTRSGSTPNNRTLAKAVQSGRFGLKLADIRNMSGEAASRSSRDCEEEAWKTFIHAA